MRLAHAQKPEHSRLRDQGRGEHDELAGGHQPFVIRYRPRHLVSRHLQQAQIQDEAELPVLAAEVRLAGACLLRDTEDAGRKPQARHERAARLSAKQGWCALPKLQ